MAAKCCPHCLKEVEPEGLIESYQVPKGCVCDPREWGDPKNIPPVCGQFEPMDEPDEKLCLHCEHEQGCHT